MTELKVTRDPSKLLTLLADDVQELIALIAEQQLMPLQSEQFEKAKLLSAQLNMARNIQDKTIFSVTGLQGAGKTTFVKRLYNLQDDLLPIDAGRSESLPILVTESENRQSGETVCKVRRYSTIGQDQCEFTIEDVVITHSNFLEIARNPKEQDLWLELEVPVTHFGEGISLALLPGFESNNRDHRSQRDLEFMLSLSTSVLFVVNYRMIAREDQRFKIQEMVHRYQDHAPLFVVSFSDELDEDQKGYYKKLLSEKLGISEEGRVTFSGNNDEDWKGEVLSSINHYGKVNQYKYKKQMEILRDLSAQAIQLTDGVKEQIQMKMVDDEGNRTEILTSEVLRTFSTYKKDIVKEVETSLHDALSQHANACSNKMDHYLRDENKGIGKSLRHFFKGDQVTLGEKILFREKTMELWNDGENQASEKIVMDVLSQHFENQAIELGFTPHATNKITSDTHALPSIHTESSFLPSTMNGQEAMGRLENYLKQQSSDLPVELEEEDLKLIPFLAVGFTTSLLAAAPALQPIKDIELGSTNEKVESLATKFQHLQFQSSSIVKGTALFMGIDAMDGTFNTFGALTGLLTKVGVSTAAAGPVAGLIIGGLVGGLAVRSGLQKIEQQRLNQSTYANMAFNMVAIQQKESVLATFDKVLGKMEQRLLSVHKQRNRVGSFYGKLDTTRYKIARIRELSGTLQGMTYRNELYLG